MAAWARVSPGKGARRCSRRGCGHPLRRGAARDAGMRSQARRTFRLEEACKSLPEQNPPAHFRVFSTRDQDLILRLKIVSKVPELKQVWDLILRV